MIPPTKLFVLHFILTTFERGVLSCGPITHMLISGRAGQFFDSTNRFISYKQLLDKHRDALQAGSTFPDSFYDPLCFGGRYHDISEDTHWTPFLNASIHYIRRTYPPPWDQATEKLVSFLLGVVSHQVADIVWHSLGINEGFLSTMAKVNFHGDFPSAHTFGDLGGEFISMVDLDADLVIDLKKWYVPSTDLYNIYSELYGRRRISLLDIEACSIQMLLESLAVSLSQKEVYPGIIDRSPFLGQEMENYFLGGVNDMVGWTHRKWKNVVTMLEQGTGDCNMTHNPLFVTCGKKKPNRRDENLQNGFYVKYGQHNLTVDDLNITRSHRGVTIQLSNSLKGFIEKKRAEINTSKIKLNIQHHNSKKREDVLVTQYSVNSSYANFGWSLSSGDVDGDGYKDTIIGSPGYSHVNNWQRGRVYILYGNGHGEENMSINLDNLQHQHINVTYIDGPNQMHSKFGRSVAVVDINVDGVDDLIVGSPAYFNKDNVDYNGLLSVYLGKVNSRHYTLPDIVITCKAKYCNLGCTLTAADVNLDGHPDLLMGTPYYKTGTGQEGMVAVLLSSPEVKAKSSFEFTSLKWKLFSSDQQPFSWFGYHISSKHQKILVSSPNYRKCYYLNCSYSVSDIQSVGRLDVFSLGRLQSNFSVTGTHQYQSAGFSADVGYPYDNQTLVLAFGIPGKDVLGSLNGFSWNIYRGGSVVLMNLTSHSITKLSDFDGNTRYGRFGYDVKLTDFNADGFDDLVISEPNGNGGPLENNKDGKLYLFSGGKHMLKGNATFSSYCTEESPCPSKMANITLESYNRPSHNGFLLQSKPTIAGVFLFSSDLVYDAGLFHHGAGRRSGTVYKYHLKTK